MSEAPAPALGYSITANIGGDRQIVFQCFVAEGEDNATVNDKLDRAMSFIDRQQARVDLPKTEEELDLHRKTLQRMRDDKRELDAKFDRDKAARQVGISALRKDVEALNNDDKARHEASGRQGEWRPSNQVKGSLERKQAAIEAQMADIQTLEAEREAALQNYATNEQRYLEEIARLEAKIAGLQDKLKGD